MAWRKWLEKNHLSKRAVWLVFYTRQSQQKSMTWSDAVDVALCFGWIDSKKVKINDETSHQYFSQRKSKSTWSKINKEKVKRLIEQGRMTEAGLKSIQLAKQNGSWTLLDEVEELIVPADLQKAFKAHPKAKAFYLSLSKSHKKILLSWLLFAKTQDTRQRRIQDIIKNGDAGLKPKHLQ